MIDSSNVAVIANQQAVPAQFVKFTQSIFNNSQAVTGLSLTQARIQQTTNELLVDTTSGYYLRFDTTGDSAEQLTAVKLALQQAQVAGQQITSYIDVRLPYKLYYR